MRITMSKRITRENRVVWQDVVIAILFGVIIVAGILCVARTIWSGYHFLDDHELLRMEQSLTQGMSLHDLLRAWIKNDMSWRFRPLYWMEESNRLLLDGKQPDAMEHMDSCKGNFSICSVISECQICKSRQNGKPYFPHGNYVRSAVYSLVS